MKLSGNFGVSPAGDDTMEIEKNKFQFHGKMLVNEEYIIFSLHYAIYYIRQQNNYSMERNDKLVVLYCICNTMKQVKAIRDHLDLE